MARAIRPLEREDLPQVAALYEHVARSGSRTPPPGLLPYFERMFLDYPWADPEIPSLVYEDEEGKIAGFLGSSVRRLTFDGRPIRLGISGQLVTEPRIRNQAAGAFLMREYMKGPQDLTITDTASELVRRIWEGIGGETYHLACIGWARVFGPWRFGAAYLGRRRGIGAIARGGRPIWRALDAVSTPLLGGLVRPEPAAGVTSEELTPRAYVESLGTVTRTLRVRPEYDETFLEWLFGELDAVRTRGTVMRSLVRSPSGDVQGWYVYFHEPGGLGQVLQIAAEERHADVVIDSLFREAKEAGAAGLQGRVEPTLREPLARRRCLFHQSGYLSLMHSRDPQLLHAIHAGRALMTRLEGEWWMGHHSEPFDSS
jgi:hypothetical protein